MSSLREAIRDVYRKAYIDATHTKHRDEDAVVIAWDAVEAWLRERDAAARQRIEALWDRQAVTGFPEEFYNRALDAVLEALGGGDE